MDRPRRARANALRFGVLAALMMALPGIAHALGLGSLKVNSALNEPLSAEIDFTSVNKKELKSLKVGLASRPEFDQAGVNRLPFLSDIKFTLAKRLDGRPFLKLSSEQPIREPFLHFLVRADWAGGRMVREFTALVDPPYLTAGRPATIEVPETAAPAPEPALAPAPAPTVAAAPPAAPPPAEPLVQDATPMPTPSVEAPTVAPSATPEPAPEAVVTAPAEPLTEPLGPSQMRDPSVAISPETGWPEVAVAEAGGETPAVEPIAEQAAPIAAMPEPTMTRAEGAPEWATVAQYEVKRGDTLWRIAEQIRIDDSLTIEQVIMALFEANRGAFFRDNVNNVWAGKVLTIPDHEEVLALANTDARTVFIAQYRDWQEYKLQLAASQGVKVAAAEEETTPGPEAAEASSETAQAGSEMAAPAKAEEPQVVKKEAPKEEPPVIKDEKPKEPEQQPIQATAPAAPAPAAKPPGNLLKIVRAAIKNADKGAAVEGEAGDTERITLAQRATTLDEALDSKQMEQKDLGERIDTIGSQIAKQKRLIELENQTVAEAQDATKQAQPRAESKPAQETPPSKPAAEAKPAEEKVAAAETAAAAAAKKEAAPQPKPRAEPKPRKQPTQVAKRKTDAPAKQRRQPRRVVPPQPPEEKGFLASIQDMAGEYLMQAVAGIVALAGGLILLTYLRRRRQAEAEFEESILTDSDAITDSAATDSGAPATASAGSTSFLSDFSQGGMGNISTDEVDPLAETEVYLAYGRDEQAEEILKDAVGKDPSRQELKVKLLEIYHQRNDVSAFETIAEELYAALEGRGGDLWNKVAEMGRALNPENPMFQGVAPAAEAPAMPQPSPMPMQQPATGPATEPEAPPVLDFEPATDTTALVAEAEIDTTTPPGLDLDLSAEQAAAAEEATADTGLEFDLDTDRAATEASAAAEEVPLPDTAELSAEELGTAALEQEEPLGLGEEPVDNVADFDITEGGEKEPALADTGELEFEADAGVALETPPAEAPADTGPEDAQQWDETATKLDLAKAYVDMGDAEGARSILDEVLAEGNEDQKKQAAELAAQIA